MMPSSDTPSGSRSSNLRRYGPLGVIVVVALVVAIVVIASRGDDKKPTATTGSSSSSSSSSGGGGTASKTGAISFSQAKAQNRSDLSFPASCDQTTGHAAVPILLAQECYADQPAATDPGTRGVTD